MNDDCDFIEPSKTTVTFDGTSFEITALRIGQIPAFTKAAKPLIDRLNVMALTTDPATLAGLIADHGDALIEAVAIAARAPREKVEQAMPDEFLTAVLTVLKVNKDFFIQRLTPAITQLVQTIGAGPTQSKPL